MASTTPLVIIIVEGTHQTEDSFLGEVLPIDKDANYQMINNYTRPKLTIITPEGGMGISVTSVTMETLTVGVFNSYINVFVLFLIYLFFFEALQE